MNDNKRLNRKINLINKTLMKFKENGEPMLRKRDINRINIEEGKKFTTPFLININC